MVSEKQEDLVLPTKSAVATFLVYEDHEERRHETSGIGKTLTYPRCGGPRWSGGPLHVQNWISFFRQKEVFWIPVTRSGSNFADN